MMQLHAIKNDANIIVVKNSIEGATVFYKDEVIEQPAFINHDFADAIGAGDSFDAGFIRQFIQEKSLKKCAELGAVCGAINTTAKGGTTAFKDFDAVKKIALEKFNYTYTMTMKEKLADFTKQGKALLAVNFYNFETLKGLLLAAQANQQQFNIAIE